MKLCSLSFLAIIVYNQAAYAAEPMSLKDIELNTTKSGFLKSFPKAVCSPAIKSSLPKCEVKGGTLGGLEIDSLSAEFWEGQLVNIGVSMISPDKEKAKHYYTSWTGKLSVKYGVPTKRDEQMVLLGNDLLITEWVAKRGDRLVVVHETFVNMFGQQNTAAVTLMRSDYVQLSTKRAVEWSSKSVKDM
jgi:hypothetical protein